MKNRKKRIRLFQLSVMRKRRRSCAVRKRFNIQRNNQKKDKQRSYKKTAQHYGTNYSERISIRIPSLFRLLKETDEVIKTINKATDYTKRHGRYIIHFEMEDVVKLDIGSIGLLLSAVNTLTRNNCSVYGTMPHDEECRQFLYDSGFLDHVNVIQGRNRKKNENSLIIERGFDKTSNLRVGQEVRKAVQYLTGKDETYRPVYSIIQEMCANSIEHANDDKKQKNWLVSIYYAEKKVIFTMTDIGQGILGTLRKKITQSMLDSVRNIGSVETLSGAFAKKYQSSTFDGNRNKGLPKIKETNTYNYIDNLKVITNDVLLDFNQSDESRRLSTKLRGTFYYWELTEITILKWKKRAK